MLSNIKKFNKTLASIPLPPQLHPELHRGINPVGSLPASAGWPTALTATWRGSAVPGCWQRYGDLGEAYLTLQAANPSVTRANTDTKRGLCQSAK